MAYLSSISYQISLLYYFHSFLFCFSTTLSHSISYISYFFYSILISMFLLYIWKNSYLPNYGRVCGVDKLFSILILLNCGIFNYLILIKIVKRNTTGMNCDTIVDHSVSLFLYIDINSLACVPGSHNLASAIVLIAIHKKT